ncbi:MAG: hypothetical protein ABWY06_18130 [Pseudomonas sp.]|uniref:hypothetical protein n=1 Tax=Pseudomonas sp. TaxID=306 RepID=UPI00339A35BF
MSLKSHCAAVLLFCLVPSLPALAESCYVTAESGMHGPSGIVGKSCFEHRGMPAGSLDWACGDRSEIGVKKTKQASCPTGYFGKCTAAMTQETLANEAASGRWTTDDAQPSTIPKDAQIITYHYQAADQSQARIDCEQGGGHWSP